MRLILLHIVVLVCSTILWGQKEFITLEATPNPVEKDQQMIITIKSNLEGQMDFSLPDEFEQSGPTQSGMSSSVNYSNGQGTVVRFSYQKLSGHFEDEGTYRVGPAKIQGKNGEVTSNVLEIKVIERQNMVSQNPADNMNRAIFGIIEQSGKEIYEGQPLVLEGKVYSQVDILQVERYTPFELDGPSESHELEQSNQVTRNFEQIAGRNVMTFRIGKTLIFPEKTGKFEIDPFETILYYDDQRSLFPERTKIRSNETAVTVKPLPDGVPPSFIEGVGAFKLETTVDTNQLQQGSVLTLRVHIMGHGNLHNIEAPKLKLPKGMVLYGDPEIKDSITFTSRGSEGMKTFTYYIQANIPGEVQIPAIKAAYFDLSTEEYQVLETTTPPIKVKPSDNAVASTPPSESEDKTPKNELLPPVNNDELSPFDGSIFTGVRGVLWSFTPIAIAFLFGFVVRRRKSTQQVRASKQDEIHYREQAFNELDQLGTGANDLETLQAVKESVQKYLAMKFDLQTAVVSTPFIKSLPNNKIDSETKNALVSLFNTIDELRYSGGAVEADGEHIANTAKRVIKKL